jgi:hypothetical protein
VGFVWRLQGHGICDSMSRSVTLSRFIGGRAELAREGMHLLRALHIPAPDIRGVGLAVRAPNLAPAPAKCLLWKQSSMHALPPGLHYAVGVLYATVLHASMARMLGAAIGQDCLGRSVTAKWSSALD